jgi:KUP system potassium uptake protein
MSDSLNKKSLATLSLAALGIVYGDIGTSPLYAFEQVFSNGAHSVPISQANVLGVLSLFFWSLMLIVTLKYVYFVMRADNQGEGGIIALMALAISKTQTDTRLRFWIILLGLMGAAFFYGDGVITPAISVLSAVEGLELISPQLKSLVIPVSIAILCILFWTQRKGTAKIGLFFGPVMLIWFVVIGLLGIWNIIQQPIVFMALNPLYALEFIASHSLLSFFAMGAVVLCLTGAEALYADMGHFGIKPIRIVWVGLVLPALVLNYFGQGALLLNQPKALDNLFYLMAPEILRTPLIILATLATVIASQAVISGTFSMTRQAIQLGFLPYIRIYQTSAEEVGQIYLPVVNFLLATLVIVVILVFQSSNALGSAYGIAVTGTMLITDILAAFVAIKVWNWQPWRAILGASAFVLIDFTFFSANSLKLFSGGWLPVVLSAMMLVIMTTWNRGRKVIEAAYQRDSVPLVDFIAQDVTDALLRVKGTAIYVVLDAHQTPPVLRKTVKYFGSVHEQVVCLNVVHTLTPYLNEKSRIQVTLCDKGFVQIQLHCGFMENVSIPEALSANWPDSLRAQLQPTVFFIDALVFVPDPSSDISTWRKTLFRFLYRNRQHPAVTYSLPVANTVQVAIPTVI